jgi:hypothetical protein
MVLLALALVAACSPPPELRDTTLLQDSSLLTALPSAQPTIEATPTVIGAQPDDTFDATDTAPTPVRDPVSGAPAVCAPPCWRGIIPGETRWSDALTIIEDDSTLEGLEIQSAEDSAAVGAQFRNVGGQRPCCQIFSSDGNTVDAVILTVAPTLTLGQLIDVWGEADYALANQFSEGQALLNVVYEDVPMVVTLFLEGTEGAAAPNSEIISIWYMTENDMRVLITTNNLHLWEGYAPYGAYDDEEGTFDITPSVTLTPVPEGG